ncbi:hypothetical protein AOLI_G00001250 [Acnodon oligacanthus]
MASAAQHETRKFTRGLSKPGTAAELRQSVSEVVRTSGLVVSALIPDPPPRNRALARPVTPGASVAGTQCRATRVWELSGKWAGNEGGWPESESVNSPDGVLVSKAEDQPGCTLTVSLHVRMLSDT